MRRKRSTKLWILTILLLLALTVTSVAGCMIASMPGKSYSGQLKPLRGEEADLPKALRRDVQKLAGDIGQRNVRHPRALQAAAKYIEASLSKAGLTPVRLPYRARGRTAGSASRT